MSVNTHRPAEKFASGAATLAKLAWTRADVLADAAWSVPVPLEVITEYKGFLATVADPVALIETVERSNVELPRLADLAIPLRERLFGRFGFVLLTGLAEGAFSEDEQRLFYVPTCLHLGEMLTPYGRLHEVADRGYDYRSSDVSVSKTRVKAPFHTDSTSKRVFPNVFGLHCLRPAMEGGRSLLVSACQVYRQIAEQTPEHLPSLFKDHFRNTGTPGDEAISINENAYPIFTWDEYASGPTFRYMRHWIEVGYAKVGETIAPEDVAALDQLEAVLADETNVFDLTLAAGEKIFIKNGGGGDNRTEVAA